MHHDMISRIARLFIDEQYRRLRLRSGFIFYFLIIVLGSIPHARAAVGNLVPGVILHALAYSFISFLLFTGTTGALFKQSAQTLLTVALRGALDEFVQSFFPYRTATMRDWLVDCTAGFITLLLMITMWPIHFRSR
jgi:VanZ family protein